MSPVVETDDGETTGRLSPPGAVAKGGSDRVLPPPRQGKGPPIQGASGGALEWGMAVSTSEAV
jgi:hypothetical protein